MRLTLTTGLLVSLMLPAAAAAQDRQRFAGTFTVDRPGATTGYRLEIEYVNPDDPDRKPYAVQRILQELHEGARIDTGALPHCRASDAELNSRGPDACPPETRVGGGEVSLDFGQAVGAVPRVVETRATLFNADRELIMVNESTNVPGQTIRATGRSKLTERTIDSMAPPLPAAPPPDAFAAIKRVRLTVDAIERRGRGYLTTPGDCPGTGRWINAATFTYRDGVAQTVRSSTPCSSFGSGPPRAAPGDRRAPAISIKRAGCRARVRISDSSDLRRASLHVNGRRVLLTTRKSFTRRLPRRRGRGRQRVTVIATDARGNRARRTVRLRSCASRR